MISPLWGECRLGALVKFFVWFVFFVVLSVISVKSVIQKRTRKIEDKKIMAGDCW